MCSSGGRRLLSFDEQERLPFTDGRRVFRGTASRRLRSELRDPRATWREADPALARSKKV